VNNAECTHVGMLQWAGTRPLKSAVSRRYMDPHLIYGSLATQTVSQSVQLFSHSLCMFPTLAQTALCNMQQ